MILDKDGCLVGMFVRGDKNNNKVEAISLASFFEDNDSFFAKNEEEKRIRIKDDAFRKKR